MGFRLWLLAPAIVLYVGDVGLTLGGQRPAYWAGDYEAAVEANPFAYIVLSNSPGLFAGLAAVWLVVMSAVVLRWRHPLARWMAVFVAVAHAIGGASWLTRTGPWGLVLAVVYLATAAQLSAWCWRQYAHRVASNAAPGTSPAIDSSTVDIGMSR